MEELATFTVSQISLAIKNVVETNFSFVRIRGEIFGSKRADSGHYYLSLKDENAVLSAVCWKGIANNLNVAIQDGIEVIATGKITTFSGKSSYQLVIEHMEISGIGTLLKLLEERKQKFAQEGLFDPAHKKPIPYLPNKIGVVTSPSGAVIRDIIHRLKDRFPVPVVVWGTPVQGAGAEIKIAQAIDGFNRLEDKPDVIIVARGGGSLEDLWCFNEEIVIRAVYNSDIPIISAVGHETDTMLIDYVSDLRAPTPTGAAEMAVPVKSELIIQVNNLNNRLNNGILNYFENLRTKLTSLRRGIPNLSQLIAESIQKLDDKSQRLKLAWQHIVDKHSLILEQISTRLEASSIQSVLNRGFAYISNKQGKIISNSQTAQKEHYLQIHFADSTITAAPLRKKDDKQGDLFNF